MSKRLFTERRGFLASKVGRTQGEMTPFGKRMQPPEREVSFRRAKLHILGAELRVLYEDRADPDLQPPVILIDEPEPHLTVGTSAVIEIDPKTGCYVFHEQDERVGCTMTITTTNEERPIDHVVSYLTRGMENFAPRTADAAVGVLVGQSIADVEQRLIVQTLWHFRGNRGQAALALGIPIKALRTKLRSYWLKRPLQRQHNEGKSGRADSGTNGRRAGRKPGYASLPRWSAEERTDHPAMSAN